MNLAGDDTQYTLNVQTVISFMQNNEVVNSRI
jgi:hypothetical protein